MNKIDPDEDEEDEDGNPIKRDKTNPGEATSGRVNSNSSKNVQVSNKQSGNKRRNRNYRFRKLVVPIFH